MADCSKTEVFLSEWKRLCKSAGDCEYCLLGKFAEQKGENEYCLAAVTAFRKEAITLMQQWSDEHPLPKQKTYADVFFEMHPKAPKTDYGTPCCCRQNVFGTKGNEDCPLTDECFECWNEPYPEQEATT